MFLKLEVIGHMERISVGWLSNSSMKINIIQCLLAKTKEGHYEENITKARHKTVITGRQLENGLKNNIEKLDKTPQTDLISFWLTRGGMMWYCLPS